MPDVVILIGSDGGLQAATILLSCLPEGFPAAVLVDLHRSGRAPRTVARLARGTSLPLRDACGGVAHRPGTVYLAPADGSVLMADTDFVDVCGTGQPGRWHRFVDVLLADAARVFGRRLVAVILSGQLDGGALGVRAVKTQGGRVLVQAPDSARAPSMPLAAVSTGCADFVLPPELLGSAVVALCAARGAAELLRVGPYALAS